MKYRIYYTTIGKKIDSNIMGSMKMQLNELQRRNYATTVAKAVSDEVLK